MKATTKNFELASEGVSRTADLGQQYDTVSRVGGNFSFLFDTFILLFITFGVVRSLSSQVGLPWFIPPRGIPMCVGPHPTLLLVLHCAGLLPASLYTRLIATAFWGPGNSAQGPLPSLELPGVLPGKSAIGSTTAPALADPLKASP